MRINGFIACALFAAAALAGGPAVANTCKAEGMTCQTGMPIDGYCECTAHGVTKDGTVVGTMKPMSSHHMAAPDCTAKPGAPGC